MCVCVCIQWLGDLCRIKTQNNFETRLYLMAAALCVCVWNSVVCVRGAVVICEPLRLSLVL